MVVFPEERAFYEKWRQALVARGVKVRLATEVDAITERTKERVKVLTRRRTPLADDHVPNEDGHPPEDQDQDAPRTEEEYDEIVLCVLADTAQRLLGKHARWIDNAVLGSTKWSDDITVTHNVGCATLRHTACDSVLTLRVFAGHRVHEEVVPGRL